MKINNLALILLATVALFSACKTAKKTTAATPTTTTNHPLSINDILQRLDDNVPQATWLAGDGSFDYVGRPLNLSGSMTIRFRRDSVIWLNVKKLGFGVARALVTRDSVFALNLIQSTYVAKDLTFMEKQFGIPADFTLLQNFLLGKPLFLTDKNQLTLEKSAEGEILLRGQNEKWRAEYRIDTATQALKQMSFEQTSMSRFVKISYENYAPLRDALGIERPFAYLRRIAVESPQTGKVSLTLDIDAETLEVNIPKTIRFEIPKSYTKID